MRPSLAFVEFAVLAGWTFRPHVAEVANEDGFGPSSQPGSTPEAAADD